MIVSALGALLLLWGMRDLWIRGGGLPMNADPPPRYVDRGIYRLLPHPIYTGFCALCVGVSISVGSASGLWLVSPLLMRGGGLRGSRLLGRVRRSEERRVGKECR